jgi:hypothetical protein
MHRSNEHDPSEPSRDQVDATKDERPHQGLAELGVCLNKGEQVRARQLDDLTRLDRSNPYQRSPARQHVGFAGELARPQSGDHSVADA